MPFNEDKCDVLHIGRTNAKHQYIMGGIQLLGVKQEKDVGVIIADSLRPSLQCAKSAKKANAVLGQLSRDRECFMSLYQTYVRPHLEYAVAAWSPLTFGVKDVLEAVQTRAVSMVTNLRGKGSQERLTELGMTSLEERRERGDLIQA